MRSLYGTILLWFAGVLAFAAVLVTVGSPGFLLRFSVRDGPLERMNLALLHQARLAYSEGGAPRLQTFLRSLETDLPARYALLDPQGRDLVTGENRSSVVAQARSNFLAPRVGGRFVQVVNDAEPTQLLIMVRPDGGPDGRRIYGIALAIISALLCWLFATRLAAPVRGLALVMDRFGQGDMRARSGIQRKDEIGDLARAYNRMADRIESLMTAERRLLQDVSHELQSPLARLTVAAKLARTAPDREAAAARVQKEVDRMAELVAGLLEVTRAEGDPLVRRRDATRLDALIQTIIDDSTLETDHPGAIQSRLEPVTIAGDQELVRRAVENVVRNALRYTPPGTSVEVDLKAAPNRAQITIRDFGPGVPEEEIDKIFAPFYRVDPARGHSSGGAGLGLSLAQRAVLLHQGTIRAENAHPGLRVLIGLPRNNSQ